MKDSMFNRKKDTNYIFTFGNVGSGKSTIMAAISKALFDNTTIISNPKNEEGTRLLMNQWISNLNNNEFPPRSRQGDIFEIDIGIEFEEISKITFLEMSGEDLSLIDRRSNVETLNEKFKTYIKFSNVFLIVVDYNKAKSDDILLWQFFNHLLSSGADTSLIGLVISKWDLNPNKTALQEYVKTEMPQTYQWLFSDNIGESKVFSFSIGEVDKNKIININLDDSIKIAKWLYNAL